MSGVTVACAKEEKSRGTNENQLIVLSRFSQKIVMRKLSETESPYFEPIIFLPALVEVKIDEDEAVIFSHRAKLYRFESSTKEWKEKGVGDIKILHNKDNNTYRILLRRYCAPNLQIKTSLIYFYTFKGSNSQIGVQSLAY